VLYRRHGFESLTPWWRDSRADGRQATNAPQHTSRPTPPDGARPNGPADGATQNEATSPPLPALDLGLAPYEPVQRLQSRLRAAVVDGAIPGVLLLLEHEPIITLGSRGKSADLRDMSLIRSLGIPISHSERGGQATLHAPGQLVSYPIVPLPRHDLRAYVHDLEEVLVVLLARLGIAAHRRDGRPGLYVQDVKIASVGLRCRRWVASHGTSLNVALDLSLFDLIVSCGEPELAQTSLAALTGRIFAMHYVKALYLEAARQVFGWDLCPLRPVTWAEVEAELGLQVPREPEVPTAGFEPATPGSGGQCSIP
jgi:lipoyl(octanoyl) transferase